MKLEYTAEIQAGDAVIAPLPDEAKTKAAKFNGKRCAVIIETADSKTLAQNKAYHSLLGCFWRSGCSSFAGYEQMKDHYKIQAGHIAYKIYVFMTPNGLRSADTLEDIPKGVVPSSVPVAGSWANISVEKAMQAITQLINDMHEAGVSGSGQGKKFDEILQGMYKESWYNS